MTDGKTAEFALRYANCNNARLVDKIEAGLVCKRGTNDTVNGNNLANLCSDRIGYVNIINLIILRNCDLYGLGVLLLAVGAGNGNSSSTCLAAVKGNCTVGACDVNNFLVRGGVGEGCSLKAKKLGGYACKKLKGGVTGVLGLELTDAVVLNRVFCRVICVECVALVKYRDGKESPNTAGGCGLCINSNNVNCAELAIELV